MDHHALQAMIYAAALHASGDCTDGMRKLLLIGIQEVADLVASDLEGREDREQYDHAIRETRLLQEHAEQALTGMLPMFEVLGYLRNDAFRGSGLPPEIE
jgi:hypothetical protein